MTSLSFDVPGVPAPQGSKRYVGNGQMVESSKALPSWRSDVRAAASAALSTDTYTGRYDAPVIVQIAFLFARPRSHYGTGRNAATLKASAPAVGPVSRNRADVDKLARAVLDAITGVVIADDSQVVTLSASKGWADHDRPGAYVHIAATREWCGEAPVLMAWR